MTNIKIGSFDPMAVKKAALEKARSAASTTAADAKIVKYISPAECADRTRIVFDDSSSMSGYKEDAKRGVVEYLRNCIPNQSAVALHFMNTKGWGKLESNLPKLSVEIQEAYLSSGSTPFFNTVKGALEASPKLTRLVAFTDGSPTDTLSAESDSVPQGAYSDNWIISADVIIKIAHVIAQPSIDSSNIVKGENCIPIDTVFFGSAYNEREIKLLKYLSDNTGGFFLHFDPQKINFAQAFKYLAPINRLRLTDGAFRESIEKGEVK